MTRSTNSTAAIALDRFEKGGELDDYGIGNWTYKQ